MGLQRNRLQSEAVRVDVQVFVGHEEEIVLPCGAKTSESREYYRLFLLEDLSHLLEEVLYDHHGLPELHVVALCIQFCNRSVVVILPLAEIQSSVWRIDGISFVGEGRRDDLSNEGSYARERYFIIVKNQLLDHFGEQVDIHVQSKIMVFSNIKQR